MAKFLPVIGEVVTGLESAGKLVAAGVTAPFNPEAGKQLLDSAGQAWVDYGKENVLACALRRDGKGIVGGADAFSKACPGVAHVRGIVHLAKGEKQEAYDCMANGTKAVGVIAATAVATVATGGMGTAPALALVGGAAAGTQVGLDGIDTGIRSATAGEFRAAGTIQGVQRAAETGNAVDIVDAILAPTQTAVMAAGSAAIARTAAAARYTAAQNENLAGTGQSLNGPTVTANPQLTAENLARVPDGPRPGMPQGAPQPAPTAPTAAPSAAPSAAESAAAGATGPGSVSANSLGAESEISLVTEAYSAEVQAQTLQENPVSLLDDRGRPTQAVQHAYGRHHEQLGFPGNWDAQTGLRFVGWLREQINNGRTVMHDVCYRGVTGHRLFFNAHNLLGVVVRVGRMGRMDLVAAFPLSPVQLRNVLSQGGRLH